MNFLFFERNVHCRVQNGMKMLWIVLFSCIYLPLAAQNTSQTRPSGLLEAGSVQVTSRLTAGILSAQVKNWHKQVMLDPTDGNAWLNYYTWTERDRSLNMTDKSRALAQITTEAEKFISGQYAYHLMTYLQSGKRDSAALLKALSVSTQKNIVYPYLVQYGVVAHNREILEKYCHAMESINPMPVFLYKYHYNVLMSADSNAVVYARGMSDLIPLAILQEVYKVRTDIRLSFYDVQENTPENGSYLCLSLGKEVLAAYPSASYTGLLVKISTEPAFEELKHNLENRMDLSYLQQLNMKDETTVQLHKNYLPPMILLYRYYVQTGNQKQIQLKTWINNIAAAAGVTGLVEKSIAL